MMAGELEFDAVEPAVPSTARSEFARKFFLVSAICIASSVLLAWGLLRLLPPDPRPTRLPFPWAFAVSSLLLMAGSLFLARSVFFVRREKQKLFRQNMTFAIVCATLFIGVQSFALAELVPVSSNPDAMTGAEPFIFVFVMLHGMHFFVALLFLVWVTLLAFRDRYDHEYHWGVKLCGWFWHFLGVVWAVILVVIFIAATTQLPTPEPVGSTDPRALQPID